MNKLGRVVDEYLYLKTLFDNVYIKDVSALKVDMEVLFNEQIHNIVISNNLVAPTIQEQVEHILQK